MTKTGRETVIKINVYGVVFCMLMLAICTAGIVQAAGFSPEKAAEEIAKMDVLQALAYAVVVLATTIVLLVLAFARVVLTELRNSTRTQDAFVSLIQGGACPIYGPKRHDKERSGS